MTRDRILHLRLLEVLCASMAAQNHDEGLRLQSEVMKNVHLACSEAFDVQLKNIWSSEFVGNVPGKGKFFPGNAPY